VPFRGRPRSRTRRHRLPHDERRPLVARYRAPPALSRLPLWPSLRSPFSFRLRRGRRYQYGCKKETYEPVLLRSKRDAAGERVRRTERGSGFLRFAFQRSTDAHAGIFKQRRRDLRSEQSVGSKICVDIQPDTTFCRQKVTLCVQSFDESHLMRFT